MRNLVKTGRMLTAAAITAGFFFSAGPAFAEEEGAKPSNIEDIEEASEESGGIGFTAGAELGFGNIADKAELALTPYLSYEASSGSVDIAAELDYTLTFSDPLAQELYAEEEIAYNFPLGDGVLSFILNNQNTVFLAPALEEGAAHAGVLEPSVKYAHTLSFGDLSLQPGFPVTYLTGVKDGEPALDAYFTLGWASNFGLGLEYTCNFGLSPESGYAGSGLLASFESGAVYAEVEFTTDKECRNFEVKPEFDFTLNSLTFTVRAEIALHEEGDASFSPFVGVGYTF